MATFELVKRIMDIITGVFNLAKIYYTAYSHIATN